MRYSVPHPIPYQGSKRRLAAAILSYVPAHTYKRLVEPFGGSGAVTLAAATRRMFESYLIADILQPLAELWESIVNDPDAISTGYRLCWDRERLNPINEYYAVRDEFNKERDPSKLLYLLARCVKNAVRFNPAGQFNQSADKRRKGTHPDTMKREIEGAHRSLANKTKAIHSDFLTMVENATPGDFFYLDPPYQGTSSGRDSRYISGLTRETLIHGLEVLSSRDVPFILSYDGSSGTKEYGKPLLPGLARRVLLDVGVSSQATLNGRQDLTVESLYISPLIWKEFSPTCFSLRDFDHQASLFA